MLKIIGAEVAPTLTQNAIQTAQEAFERYGVDPAKCYAEYQKDVEGFAHDEYLPGMWAVVEAQALYDFADYTGVRMIWED